ncbi:hypothetical protein AMD27_10735 [Acinetobacter sp. TGL-Y2]|uniref:DUF3465 domain-containing protein n=1 Tax=Acinetobacter sp. TGL-Y2 TaxID=1407071 RepID=UPI0007A665D1|nr:DUF3465 domain-containing protein [Acinetobacter sp. TGL-Y2]AMW79326.1 hypothetical protein AMD27_10735 [Acinetobacter sp. TGL-Y2]
MAKKANMGILGIVLVVLAAIFGWDLTDHHANTTENSQHIDSNTAQRPEQHTTLSQNTHAGVKIIEQAFQQKQSNIQVHAAGTVKAVLRDDNEGSPHQKFILELNTGQTVLVAHNIDLAPRIEVLQKGDQVEFFGEYEYSAQGGVIHWTHHDPQKNHVDGWLKHKNKTYE